jgi:hypothetical protein
MGNDKSRLWVNYKMVNGKCEIMGKLLNGKIYVNGK